MGTLVILIQCLRPGSPSAHIIVAHHIQFIQELLRRSLWLRTNLIIGLGYRPFRIQLLTDFL